MIDAVSEVVRLPCPYPRCRLNMVLPKWSYKNCIILTVLVVVLLCALKVQVPDIIEDSFSRQSAAERSPSRRPAASEFSQWTRLVDSSVESVVEEANKEANEDNDDVLTKILTDRLSAFSSERVNLNRHYCPNDPFTACTFVDSNCTGTFSASPRERLRQVLATRVHIPSHYQQAIATSTKRIAPHKYIFVTAVSSNHYQEMQGLVRSVHQDVFPRLTNYSFVFFDLGLTPVQRNTTEENCRCTVLDFPFRQLPGFMRELGCYTWKPVIIASLIEKAEYLIWMDASIRWKVLASLDTVFEPVRQRGVQLIPNNGSIAVRTFPPMFDFYGDQQCQYAPFGEMQTGILMFYSDRFMREAIIPAWTACAFDQRCICIPNSAKHRECGTSPPRRYSRCHRYEQSSLGIILSKLLLDQRPMVYLPSGTVRVARGENHNWFQPRKPTGNPAVQKARR